MSRAPSATAASPSYAAHRWPATPHSQIRAGTGIATDLTRYLMRSEQIASLCPRGVQRRDGVAAAGGDHPAPHAPEEAIRTMETPD
jgi:hypothetical protein